MESDQKEELRRNSTNNRQAKEKISSELDLSDITKKQPSHVSRSLIMNNDIRDGKPDENIETEFQTVNVHSPNILFTSSASGPPQLATITKDTKKQSSIFNRAASFIRAIYVTIKTSRALQMILGLFLLSLILGILAYIYRDKLLPILNRFAFFVATNGVPGGLLYITMIVITCFPPMIGYSLLLTLSGYIYGVGYGFLVNYIGALVGGTLCFVVARYMGKSFVQRWYGGQAYTASTAFVTSTQAPAMTTTSSSDSSNLNDGDVDVESTGKVEKEPTKYAKLIHLLTRYLNAHPSHSYKLLIFLRLAPYPYNILNVLLAQIPAITITQFIIVTGVSLVKVALHAWLGSTLSQLSDLFQSPVNKIMSDTITEKGRDGKVRVTLETGQIAQIIVLAIAIVFAIVGAFYLYRTVNRALAELEDQDHITLEDLRIDEDVDLDEDIRMIKMSKNK